MTKSDKDLGGVISEEEAAKLPASEGEKEANARAAAHRKQKFGASDTPVITEAEAAKEGPQGERIANENAARHRAEAHPDPWAASITTEPEVVAEVHAEGNDELKPKRNTADTKPRTKR